MLWASDALGRDGKPAVLLLSATRTRATITAELAYVAADLPEGPLPGRYYRTEGAEPEPVVIAWPDDWPAVTARNRLHPRDTTPLEVVALVDGATRACFDIVEEVFNEQAQV